MLVPRTMHILADLPAFCARRGEMDKSTALRKFKRHLHKTGQVHSLLELLKPGHGCYGRAIATIWPNDLSEGTKKARFLVTGRPKIKGTPKHIRIPIREKKISKRSGGGGSGGRVKATGVAFVNTSQYFDPMALGLSKEMAKLILEERIDYMDCSMDI
ncbi:hypothetical protein TWF506_011154 [Arthrobotrys conoides]|uniref:Uncharacterized protein n=1 Tax=Arthrobotrys conoides TaxID=74498 RepID=A0AAN8NA29_9PEZI